MSNKPDRRKFIKNLSVGGLTAGIMPSTLFESSSIKERDILDENVAATEKRNYNGPYTGEFLNRVAFPRRYFSYVGSKPSGHI